MKILLTATVTPQVTWDLHIRDPGARRGQYVEALRRWVPVAAAHGATLVLVENSGEDLTRLTRDAVGTVPGHLCLVDAPAPDPADVERGKGATEAAMMDLFCDRFFDGPEEAWYKVTGRLFVKNFGRCVPDSLPPDSVVARVGMNLRQMDTRFFGATAGLWHDHFRDAGRHVDDRAEVFIEKVLMRRVLTALGEGAQLLRFRAQPAWYGRSGTHADRVYDSLPNRVKRLATNQVENVLRGPLHGKQY
ncbi:hypothetical protein SAMN04488107_4244 [Geodermatophilus saharensis]|uniref:Uncharacterized protein n=1 Tax=Geodermatophilus saharensis TaxID=1137994 RepID=A0A239I9R2_9ACTN|nr:hypothetical protein [Geodermatophilus saharensis]SNS90279.1 hypothetical protein SAMN04488107_4244 [Geodermatophilus saharensis]